MSIDLSRSEYLEKHWLRYPLKPEGVSFFGRLQCLVSQEMWSCAVERENKIFKREFPNLQLQGIPNASVLSVLSEGDLIAISDDGQVTLLAPHLQKLPGLKLARNRLQQWQEFVFWVRQFFREKFFLEVNTPSLVVCPGTEPSLDYFSTEFVQGSRRQKLYLPTSPELHLKKALALGAGNIFEIKNCFRNGEVTEHHQPEFTMIEWYRSYETLDRIQKDVAELVQHLVTKMPGLRVPEQLDRFSMAELFQKYCDFRLTPQTTQQDLQKLAQKLSVDVQSATQMDDYFFLIFLEKIESALPGSHLTFVTDYPPYQAALARLTEDGWGDRFEVYWQGLEIANAFHELNDPVVQRQRFAEDLEKKRRAGKEVTPLDAEFLQCLEAGMPPSAGIALGLERLFMALTGAKTIAELRVFPQS